MPLEDVLTVASQLRWFARKARERTGQMGEIVTDTEPGEATEGETAP